MSNDTMVVIVTGANRGIGRAICELVLQKKPEVHLVATSRAGDNLEFKTQGSKVAYHKLDVADPASVKSFAASIKKEFPSGIDALINNAGLNTYPEHTPKSVKQMLDLNFRGTRNMCLAFLPELKDEGRIVNLSSTASSLSIYSKKVAEQFRHISTLDEAEDVAQHYEKLVANGQEHQSGFGKEGDGYPVSKALVNAMTKILAASPEASKKHILINACCPGWVDTEMGNIMGKPKKTTQDAAKIPVHLALDPISENGKYWANDSISSTDNGKVQSW